MSRHCRWRSATTSTPARMKSALTNCKRACSGSKACADRGSTPAGRLEKGCQLRRQRWEIQRELGAIDEIGLAGHSEELGRRGGAIAVEPGPDTAKALGDDDLFAKLLV